MNISARKLSVLFIALAGLALSLGAFLPAAHAASATAHAMRGRGPLAIKVGRGEVNKNVKTVGVHKASSRGPGDFFHVDNRTDYSIDIYVNGDYKGTVGPVGDLYIEDQTGGEYTATAAAPGTSETWGPISFSTPFTWTLTY